MKVTQSCQELLECLLKLQRDYDVLGCRCRWGAEGKWDGCVGTVVITKKKESYMFRKNLICLGLLLFLFLIALPTFAEIEEEVYTSEGWYLGYIDYVGQYCGQARYSYAMSFGDRRRVDRLSGGQLEVVNKMLNRYRTSVGNTFFIIISSEQRNGRAFSIMVFCEFTSSSNYNWWAYR
jgi:hypothetical protein